MPFGFMVNKIFLKKEKTRFLSHEERRNGHCFVILHS